jgi:hypothetical protein
MPWLPTSPHDLRPSRASLTASLANFPTQLEEGAVTKAHDRSGGVHTAVDQSVRGKAVGRGGVGGTQASRKATGSWDSRIAGHAAEGYWGAPSL